MAQVLGVKIDDVSSKEILEVLGTRCSVFGKKEPFFITTVNPEFVMLAQDDPEFKNILNSADLAIADGVGLRIAQQIQNLKSQFTNKSQKTNLKKLEIIPGRKLVEELIKTNKYKMFYLGGRNDVSGEMAKKFGGFSDEGESNISNPTRNQEIINKINKFKPDILLVAYGAPWQEKWIYNNRKFLNARVCIGVGGAFDYLTGQSSIPPEWVNRMGFEWLWRLVCEPWRWRRQLGLLRFVFKLL